MKNILFLYSEVMPYNIPVFRELVKHNYMVHVVRWDKCNLTPYVPPSLDGVIFYNRSTFRNIRELYNKVVDIEPCVIYTSGWMDKGYCSVTKRIKRRYGTPIIAACDTQWRGGTQWINVILSPIRHRLWFSHILIAGIWQFEYARRLGFKKNKILSHVYSADIDLFNTVNVENKVNNYPKNLLYIGRFSNEKGIFNLIEAWNCIENYNGWTLTLIGNGTLKDKLIFNETTIVKDFMSQKDLLIEMEHAGCFVLPSTFEPWALVLHEAAAAGLPILSSSLCGAAPYFVLENYNGYQFDPHDVNQLKDKIIDIINCPVEKLIDMSLKSCELSKRIKPEIVANAIMSVIK